MKKIVMIASAIVAAAVIISATMILLTPKTITVEKAEPLKIEKIEIQELTHRQDTWLRALEWCESRGDTGAVNPEDRDGTPSYYSWQFKPDTFRRYGEKYGMIPKGLTDEQIAEAMKDYDKQKAIVTGMIKESIEKNTINWEHKFPSCVRKLGIPPKN